MKVDHDMQSAAPAINTRSGWRPVLRPIGQLLIAAQLALVLQPLSVLAQDKGTPAYNPVAQAQIQRLGTLNQTMEKAKADKLKEQRSPADKVSDKFKEAHELVAQIKKGRGSDKPAKVKELKLRLNEIQAGAADVRAEFAATRSELQRKNLPAEILARHDEAVAQFEQRAIQFNQISARPNDDQVVDELASFFDKFPARKRHTPMDPGKLPWGSPKATPRMPAESKISWYQILTKDHKVQLAQAGGLTTIGGVQFSIPPEPAQAPQDADLAETPDVQLTPAIRAKALELGNNPVNIHNWVRNNIQWLPTWGSVQGADGALKTLRGNAFDTASLTIALLRASGIPARYQFGTIDVPSEQAMNWVGGVQRPEAALNLMYQGGIAARGIASSGRLSTIRMEHVWVNAYVNWSPSRGGKDGGYLATPALAGPHGGVQHPNPNAALNAWTPLDASFKQYAYTQGMDLQTQVPLDANALIAAAGQGATVTPNYAQNLNAVSLKTELANYQNRLKSYIDSSPTGANSTVGDVLGSQRIQTRTLTVMPGALPYTIVVHGNERSEVPVGLRWMVALRLYQSDADSANDSPSVTVERPLAQLNDRRLAISFEPATPTDQQIINSAAQAGQTSFAAYLTRYSPKIKLDFDVLATGYAQQPGVDGKLTVVMKGPTGETSRDYNLTSGTTAVLVLNPAGTPTDKYTNRARDFALTELDTGRYGLQGLAEEMLHQIGLAWWAQKYVAQDNLAASIGVVQYMLPSHTFLLAPISVNYMFGVPRSASYKTRAMDAKLDYVMLEQKEGDQAKRREFMRAAGKLGSYLEGAVFDQAFNPLSPGAVSTISLIGQAQAQGAKVYTLSSGDEVLVSQLQTTPEVQAEIGNALAYGRVVTVPETEVSLGSYTGLGYVIEDPNDGSAAYQIDGGRSGGEAPSIENVIPIPAMPDANYLSLLLGGQLRAANAKLAVNDGGMIVGLVLPVAPAAGAVPPLAALLGLIALLLLLSQGQSNVFDKTYPPEMPPKRFRHYTNAQAAIFSSGYLLFSTSGETLGGGGVYVADAVAEEARGVTCATLNSTDIVTRFQMPPPPNDPDPKRVTGFVEITETLRGWLYYESKTNSVGQLEYILRRPASWVVNPNKNPGQPILVKALLAYPFMPASLTDRCN